MTRPAIHPGEILAEELEEIAITPTELARQIRETGFYSRSTQAKLTAFKKRAHAMDRHHAAQIADLLNSQNELVRQYDADRVLSCADNYLCELSGRGGVVACVELKRVQWYQFEIDHLTVTAEFRGKGMARKLLGSAEDRAKQSGGRILQCTIREGNDPSKKLFANVGFAQVSSFYYPISGNNVGVWQKVISLRN